MRSCLRLKPFLFALLTLSLLAPASLASATTVVTPGVTIGSTTTVRPHAQILPTGWGVRKFDMLAWDTINPKIDLVQYSYSDPDRQVTETEVDNERDFNSHLATNPDGVTLVTDTNYLLSRHNEFLTLASTKPMLITVAIHGDLATLENFALYTLGIPEIAAQYGWGSSDGMLVLQYLQTWNTAYLLGDDTYTKGLRATYPSEFPIAAPANAKPAAHKATGIGTGIIIYVLSELIEAALEEPEWNDNHYMSGKMLGKLGLDWDTAFYILYQWEMFEQWINDLGDSLGQNWEVGEDIWGIIWDLIWGMTGYLDGVLFD